MSKAWKIVLWILGIMLALAILLIGLLIWGWTAMQGVAKDVYGGPMPQDVSPMVGFSMQGERIGMYMDMTDGLMVILVDKPAKADPSKPFSLPKDEVREALAKSPFLKGLIGEMDMANAEPVEQELMDRPVQFLMMKDPSQPKQHACAGVLNLPDKQLTFMAMGSETPDLPEKLDHFLEALPAVQNAVHPAH